MSYKKLIYIPSKKKRGEEGNTYQSSAPILMAPTFRMPSKQPTGYKGEYSFTRPSLEYYKGDLGFKDMEVEQLAEREDRFTPAFNDYFTFTRGVGAQTSMKLNTQGTSQYYGFRHLFVLVLNNSKVWPYQVKIPNEHQLHNMEFIKMELISDNIYRVKFGEPEKVKQLFEALYNLDTGDNPAPKDNSYSMMTLSSRFTAANILVSHQNDFIDQFVYRASTYQPVQQITL